MKARKLLIKEPFKRIIPKGYYGPRMITMEGKQAPSEADSPLYEIITQADFLRELHPSGHKINDSAWYPDKSTYMESEEIKAANAGRGAWVTERVTRCAVPLQFVILIKHLVHLGANPINILSSNRVQSDEEKDALAELRQGWKDKNMEVAKWMSFKGAKATGDVACVIYFDRERKVSYKVLSYLEGDKLYPHFDLNGELVTFARAFKRTSEDGREVESYVEVWDDKYAYLFKRDTSTPLRRLVNTLLETFGLDGYTLLEGPTPHGFPRIPVVYKRLDGPCWGHVQETIDNYELSLSQLCESNKVYAFPIITMIGEDADIQVSTNGRPFAITSTDPEAKIGILNNNTATDSFKLQIETQYKTILLGSFVVTPPELKSGDLPGAAIKLIYSPALENAINDAHEWNSFIDELFALFTYAYGIEKGISSIFSRLNAHATIEPYVHQNTAETIQLLTQAVQTGILSIETAIENNPFSMTDEQKRVLEERISYNLPSAASITEL